jgi:hypothetical protein
MIDQALQEWSASPGIAYDLMSGTQVTISFFARSLLSSTGAILINAIKNDKKVYPKR